MGGAVPRMESGVRMTNFIGIAISTREAASRLGCSLTAIYHRIVKRKTLRGEKLGGRWIVDSADLERKPSGRPRAEQPEKPKRGRGRPRRER
jgi:excisionase family DNA binding protein